MRKVRGDLKCGGNGAKPEDSACDVTPPTLLASSGTHRLLRLVYITIRRNLMFGSEVFVDKYKVDKKIGIMTTNYKKAYCFVPMCENTKRRTPDKLFFVIPEDKKTRDVWCKAARRDMGRDYQPLVNLNHWLAWL